MITRRPFKMIFRINPMLVENFLRIERSETLPHQFTRATFYGRKFRRKRFVGLVIKDQAIQVGKKLQTCPHVRGTYQQFSQEMEWGETEYRS